MSALRESLRRVWYLLNRRRFEDALREEIETHRSMMADASRFGNTLRLREESRDVWGWTWLDDVLRDVRFAWRTLRRTPGVTVVAIASLALATGATTAIFSVVNGVLLRPLPFEDSGQLVQVYGRNWREDRGGPPDPLTGPVASPELEAFAEHSTSFIGFAGYEVTTRHLGGAVNPERLTAVMADLSFFDLLGVDATIGRTFRPGDPVDVAVVSARLWRQRFDSDTSLPGRSIDLDGRAVTVLGVMPDGFQFPYKAASLLPGALPEGRTDVWVPLAPLRGPEGAPLRRGRLSVIARLKPGVAVEAGESELGLIARQLEEQYRGTRVRIGVRIVPLTDVVVGQVRSSLWMLFAAVGLVLAAACANVANVLLSRMTERVREVATRAALGASRQRLVRQFLAESLLLSTAGGLFGAAIARWGTDLVVAVGAAKIPRAHEIALDWSAFGFLFAICLATAVLFGLAPALTAARVEPQSVSRAPVGHHTIGASYGRLRDGLAVIEIALAFVLALGAAVVVREVIRLRSVPTGMMTENVLTLHLTPRASAQDYAAIEERVAQVAGVRAAGLTQLVPLQNWGWTADFSIRGQARSDRSVAGLRYVTPGYFRALGIPLHSGRTFTNSDTAEAARVIVINDALARRYFADRDPVGVELDRGTIVGVVGSVRQAGLNLPPEPEIYYPASQNLTMASDIGMSLVVRAVRSPTQLTDPIRAVVREVNSGLAIFNVRTMEQVVADSLWELHLYRWLIGCFAGLALVLAAIGLYGVISYSVTSRIREFAVRLALGAEPAGVSGLVLGRAMRLAGAGVCAGVAMALAVTVFIWNPELPVGTALYVLVAILVMAIALAACLVPAIRVSRLDPATALRHE